MNLIATLFVKELHEIAIEYPGYPVAGKIWRLWLCVVTY